MVRVRLMDMDRAKILGIGSGLGLALGPLSTVIFTFILMIRKPKLSTREYLISGRGGH